MLEYHKYEKPKFNTKNIEELKYTHSKTKWATHAKAPTVGGRRSAL